MRKEQDIMLKKEVRHMYFFLFATELNIKRTKQLFSVYIHIHII